MKRKHIASAALLFLVVPQLAAQQTPAADKAAPKTIVYSAASTEARDEFQAAVFNSQMGYNPRAIERARATVAKDPSFALNRAYFNYLSGNNAAGDAAVAEASKGTLGEVLLANIWKEGVAGRSANAAALAKAAAEIFPDDPFFAMEVVGQSNPGVPGRKARIAGFDAIGEKYKYAPGYRSASNNRLADGDTAGAIADAEKAVALSPTSGSSHGWLGRLYQLSGNLTAAREHYAKAIEVSPTNGDVHQQMAELETMLGNHAAARQHIAHAVERGLTDNDKLRFHRALAVSYAVEGRYADARKELDAVVGHAKAINDEPQLQIAYRNLAQVAAVLKTPDQIQPNLDAALAAKDPASAHHLGALMAWIEAGNAAEAQKSLDAWLATGPANPTEAQKRTNHLFMGAARLPAKDPAGALQHLAEADPNAFFTQYYTWKAHVMAGHKKEAAAAKATLMARTDFNFLSFPGAVALSQAKKK